MVGHGSKATCPAAAAALPVAGAKGAATLLTAPLAGATKIAAKFSKGATQDRGKSESKGKGKGKDTPKLDKRSGFQIKLEGQWKMYDKDEDMILKRAFLIGHSTARYAIRGQMYEYRFTPAEHMTQLNLETQKERQIRPPMGIARPQRPLLPQGPCVVVIVAPGSSGGIMQIPDPNNPGQKLTVNVPSKAKTGQKMAVPVPEKGQTVEQVAKKQKEWSMGSKVATGAGAVGVVGAAAVGGALLGDHLAGGDMAGDVADFVTSAVADAGDWAADAGDDAVDWADDALSDVGDWSAGAAADAWDWVTDAAGDGVEWVDTTAEDVGEWLGEAAEDAGDFIMDLF